jgi:hypothetical protein
MPNSRKQCCYGQRRRKKIVRQIQYPVHHTYRFRTGTLNRTGNNEHAPTTSTSSTLRRRAQVTALKATTGTRMHAQDARCTTSACSQCAHDTPTRHTRDVARSNAALDTQVPRTRRTSRTAATTVYSNNIITNHHRTAHHIPHSTVPRTPHTAHTAHRKSHPVTHAASAPHSP